MKSESQAYQAIRKYWKTLRNNNQRQASIYDWVAKHQQVHPIVKATVSAITNMDITVMPVIKSEYARREADKCNDKVSLYQLLLNKYKVQT